MSTAILETSAALRESFVNHYRAIEAETELPMGFEFVDGELKELNVSNHAALVTNRISFLLNECVNRHQSGWMFSEAASYRCFPHDPDMKRRGDVTFHCLERLTAAQAVAKGSFTLAPDIVVEVVSPHDTNYEVNAKRLDWLSAGAQLVWLVYPIQREVHVFRPEGSSVLYADDTLTADPVLPGFSVAVAELFRMPSEEIPK